jgi:hypothetical protein
MDVDYTVGAGVPSTQVLTDGDEITEPGGRIENP